MALLLQDLIPEETTFKLHKTGDKKYWICAFSLRVRVWIQQRYKLEEFEAVLKKSDTAKIAELVYFMLKDKSDFPTQDDFFDAIRTPMDNWEIHKAVLHSMGVSEPRAEELAKEISDPKAKSLNQNA